MFIRGGESVAGGSVSFKLLEPVVLPSRRVEWEIGEGLVLHRGVMERVAVWGAGLAPTPVVNIVHSDCGRGKDQSVIVLSVGKRA